MLTNFTRDLSFRKLEDTTEDRLEFLEMELKSLPKSFHILGNIHLRTLRERKDNVEITFNSGLETLLIKDLDGIQEDIFFQGSQVEPFVAEACEILRVCPVLAPEEALYLATWSMVESLWN